MTEDCKCSWEETQLEEPKDSKWCSNQYVVTYRPDLLELLLFEQSDDGNNREPNDSWYGCEEACLDWFAWVENRIA